MSVIVQDHVQRAETANGRPFVSAPLRPAVRSVLLNMLRDLTDITADQAALATDNDLCAMYAVARTDASRAYGTAAGIARKLKADPFGFTPSAPPPPPAPPAPRAPRQDPPAPRQDPPAPRQDPPAPAQVDWQRVRDIASEEANRAATAATQDAHDRVTNALAELPGIVEAAARKAVEAQQPTNLVVQLPNAAPAALGVVHHKQATLIQMLAAGCNVYLHGPAGSGKTTAGRKAAEALKVSFHFAAKVESEYLLLGFTDARGEAVRTPFREAYENGGVFLFDEMDGSSPGAVVAMNAALANGVCPFPDKLVERHPDFYCIGAGNTVLTGANRQYVGRQPLDAASIDRFAFLDWGYDPALEAALATDTDWLAYVRAARKAVEARGLESPLITPRAVIDGCKLLACGMTREEVANAVLWKGTDPDTVRQIVGSM